MNNNYHQSNFNNQDYNDNGFNHNRGRGGRGGQWNNFDQRATKPQFDPNFE